MNDHDSCVTYQHASVADAYAVAPHLRDADVAECFHAYGRSPMEMLPESIRVSPHCWVAKDDEGIVSIFGVGQSSLLSQTGNPWLVGTNRMMRYRRELLRKSRDMITAFRGEYKLLENWVDVRNIQSIRWLRWCGFKFDEPGPFGVFGLPFVRFSMKGGR